MKRILTFTAAVAALALLFGCRNNAGNDETTEPTDSTAIATDSTAVAAALEEPVVIPEEPVLDIVTSMGTIKVKLYSKTPKHRDNFVKLARTRYYDGILFHRVINQFMIQAGDPYTKDTAMRDHWGEGGPGYTVPAEFVNEYYHKKGALAAARMSDLANPKKASSGSQFYIVQDEMNCLHLDGQYTIFGETISGLDVIDRIASVPTDPYDRPTREVKIISIRLDNEANAAGGKPKEEAAAQEKKDSVAAAQ